MSIDPQQVSSRLSEHFGKAPRTAIVLGSGAGGVVDALSSKEGSAAYNVLGFPATGVAGHSGAAHVGILGGQRVVVMGGRFHAYEGHAGAVLAGPVRALHAWGVTELVLTSAVGSLDADVGPGSLVLIEDHINLMGDNPLRGPHSGPHPRFVDMADAYSPRLRRALLDAAVRRELELLRGIYAAMPGPSYETAAEVTMLAGLGARVVGMSVVPEVIAARQVGLEVAAISIVANLGTGLAKEHVTHAQVTEAVGAATERLTQLLSAFLEAR